MNGLTPLEKKALSVTQLVEKDRKVRTDTTMYDKVELSDQGKDITRFMDLIGAVSDIRESRVEEVRCAIEGGTYNVRMEQVAEKIMGGNLLNKLI